MNEYSKVSFTESDYVPNVWKAEWPPSFWPKTVTPPSSLNQADWNPLQKMIWEQTIIKLESPNPKTFPLDDEIILIPPEKNTQTDFEGNDKETQTDYKSIDQETQTPRRGRRRQPRRTIFTQTDPEVKNQKCVATQTDPEILFHNEYPHNPPPEKLPIIEIDLTQDEEEETKAKVEEW